MRSKVKRLASGELAVENAIELLGLKRKRPAGDETGGLKSDAFVSVTGDML